MMDQTHRMIFDDAVKTAIESEKKYRRLKKVLFGTVIIMIAELIAIK